MFYNHTVIPHACLPLFYALPRDKMFTLRYKCVLLGACFQRSFTESFLDISLKFEVLELLIYLLTETLGFAPNSFISLLAGSE